MPPAFAWGMAFASAENTSGGGGEYCQANARGPRRQPLQLDRLCVRITGRWGKPRSQRVPDPERDELPDVTIEKPLRSTANKEKNENLTAITPVVFSCRIAIASHGACDGPQLQ